MRFDQVQRDLGTARRPAFVWRLAKQVTQWVHLHRDTALAAGLAALALLPRLYGLADKPFWYDEILTWGRAKLPLAELVVNVLKHKHFPTYFLLLAPLYSTRSPEWMLRLPSALFGAACVFLVARIAVAIRGPWAGIVAGLLMALSPIEVQFAQEARPYTLISCLVLIALCGLVGVAQGSARSRSPEPGPAATPGAWMTYTLGTLGALLVENNTIPWLLASNVAIMVIAVRATSGRRAFAHNWAWSQAVIVLVWLPALITMLLMNRGAVLDGLEWIPKATWESAKTATDALYLFRILDLMTLALFPSALPEFGIVVALVALLGAWRLKSEPNLLAVIGLAVVAMPLAVLAAAPFQPLLVPRYLLWSTGPFFVLAGVGATAFPRRFLAPIAVAAAIGGAVCLAPYYSAETKPRWDQAAAYLDANVKPHDVIVAQNPSVKFVLASFAQRLHPRPEIPIVSWDPRDPLRQVPEGGRAWAVYGRVGQGPQQPEADFRREWSAFGTPAEEVRIGASILILRFDPPRGNAQHLPGQF
jgi:mannosyltransferase